MSESELYKDLGSLTKDKNRWKESIPYVSSLLTHESVKIQAKVLWLLGEMGWKNRQEQLSGNRTILEGFVSVC